MVPLSRHNLVKGRLTYQSRTRPSPVTKVVWFVYVAAPYDASEVIRFPLRNAGHLMEVQLNDLLGSARGDLLYGEYQPGVPRVPDHFGLLRCPKLKPSNIRPTATKDERGRTFTVWSLWVPDDQARTGRRSFEIWANGKKLETRNKSRKELERGTYYACPDHAVQPSHYKLFERLPK